MMNFVANRIQLLKNQKADRLERKLQIQHEKLMQEAFANLSYGARRLLTNEKLEESERNMLTEVRDWSDKKIGEERFCPEFAAILKGLGE